MTLNASLIIVNYRSEDHVRELLDLLFSRPGERPAQVIVVDNSPSRGLGGSPELKEEGTEYVPSPRNIGFAGGVNLALPRAREHFLILLNPDARPEPLALAGLVRVLSGNPAAAVAGPRILPFASGGAVVPSATRKDPDLVTLLAEYTPLRSLLPKGWLARNYFLVADGERGPVECAMVQGACLALAASWLRKIGNFDEDRFFLYWEETDFCRRARMLGGAVLYCPALRCRHLGGASIDRAGQDTLQFWLSFHAYREKYHGPVSALVTRLLLASGIAAEDVILTVKALLDRQVDGEYRDVVRKRLRAQFQKPRPSR